MLKLLHLAHGSQTAVPAAGAANDTYSYRNGLIRFLSKTTNKSSHSDPKPNRVERYGQKNHRNTAVI